MAEYVLIACCKKKQGQENPQKKYAAQEIYQGTLFSLSMEYARKCLNKKDEEIFILSAKHHLLRLNDSITYYDEYLGNKKAPEIKAWTRVVENKMAAAGMDLQKDSFVILAGKKYWQYLNLKKENVKRPMDGVGGIGKMLHFLKEQMSSKK